MVTRAGEREISAVSGRVGMYDRGPFNSILYPHPPLPSLPTPSLQNVISEEVAVLVPWTFKQKYILSPFFCDGGTREEVKSLLALKGKTAHIIKTEYNDHLNNNITSAQHVGTGRISDP